MSIANKTTVQERDRWGSKIGFIFAAASWSVGLGNIWRFPYVTGKYGGAAFLIIYVLMAVIVAIPLMMIEYSLGRESQSSPLSGGKILTKNKFFQLGGGFGFIGGLMIFSYYVMIIGWVIKLAFDSVTGSYMNQSAEEIGASFDALTANTPLNIGLEIFIFIILGVVVSRGLKKGIEAVAKVAMPLMFLLFICLSIYGLTLKGSSAGLDFYLRPDFSKIGPDAFVVALGQVFMSIGVGQGVSWVYGSYLSKNDNIPRDMVKITIMDTAFALVSGLIIFTFAFSAGIEPDSGFSLLFKTMPVVFSTMPGGRIVAVLFFVGALFAAMTTAIAFAECMTSSIMDAFKWDRNKMRPKATWLTLGLVFLLSLCSVLSFGSLSDVRWFGMSMFDFIDYTSSNIFLVLSGLIMCLLAAWGFGIKKYMSQVNEGVTGKFRVTEQWNILLKFLIPGAIIVILITSNF